MRPLLVQGARLASIEPEAMLDYNSAAQNRTVVSQLLSSEKTAKRARLEACENTATLSETATESDIATTLRGSHNGLSAFEVDQ